jgi:hypothetical protein
MFTDNINTTDLTKQEELSKIAEDEAAEYRRFIGVRIADELQGQTKAG